MACLNVVLCAILCALMLLASTAGAKFVCDSCVPFSDDCTHGMREIMNRTEYELVYRRGFTGKLRVHVDGQPTPLFFQMDCMDLRHSMYLYRDEGGWKSRVARMVETTFWTRIALARRSYFFDCKFRLGEFEAVEQGKMFLAIRWFYLDTGSWSVQRDINLTTPFYNGLQLTFLDLAHNSNSRDTMRGAYEMGNGPSGAVYVVYGQDPVKAKAEKVKGDDYRWKVTIYPYQRPVNSTSVDPHHDPRYILTTLGYMVLNFPMYSSSCRSLYQGLMYSCYSLGFLLFLAFLLYPHGGEWMTLATYELLMRLPCMHCLRGRDQRFYASLRRGHADSKLAFWADLEEEAEAMDAAMAGAAASDEDDYAAMDAEMAGAAASDEDDYMAAPPSEHAESLGGSSHESPPRREQGVDDAAGSHSTEHRDQ